MKRFWHYFDNKVLFKNNRPIVFQFFGKLTEFQTIEKKIGLSFSNNTLFLKYSSKAITEKEDPRIWIPFCTFLHKVVIFKSYLPEKIPEVHINNQVC